jgi:hypothetical protein
MWVCSWHQYGTVLDSDGLVFAAICQTCIHREVLIGHFMHASASQMVAEVETKAMWTSRWSAKQVLEVLFMYAMPAGLDWARTCRRITCRGALPFT